MTSILVRFGIAAACALTLALSLPACAPVPRIDNEFVIGGELDTTHTAVGLLDGCTGTVVLDQCTVLTAAHCVQYGAYAHFYLGDEAYEAASFATHPRYGETVETIIDSVRLGESMIANLPVADIAVVKLREPCPDVTPMQLASAAPAEDDEISVLGFGMTTLWPADNGPDLGQEPETPPPGRAEPIPPTARPPRYIGYNTIADKLAMEFTFEGILGVGATTCNGDSGGPSLRWNQGREEVLGVHSIGLCQEDYLLGYTDLEGNPYSEEHDWRVSIDVSVPDYASWIRNPVICTPGDSQTCGDGGRRHCDVSGMWNASCQPSEP